MTDTPLDRLKAFINIVEATYPDELAEAIDPIIAFQFRDEPNANLDLLQSDLRALVEENERLREALKPFAEWGSNVIDFGLLNARGGQMSGVVEGCSYTDENGELREIFTEDLTRAIKALEPKLTMVRYG